MMKVNFLKRLESSVCSFAITMRRTVNKIKDLEDRINQFLEIREGNEDLDLAAVSPEDEAEDDDLRDALEVGKGLVYKMAHLDVHRWLRDLKRDRVQLEYLAEEAEKITADRDAKLAELKNLIEQKVMKPSINAKGAANRKVLVFTAFSDTADYLHTKLHDWARDELRIHVAFVSGGSSGCKTSFGKREFNNILTNFSPIAKNRAKMKSMPQEGEIDLLIATDCISEGQNLQDCDYLINYDIHWNPVRIITEQDSTHRLRQRL
jgi:ERCC4-related helicase